MKKISLIIPCYNEEKNVSLFYDECKKIFESNLNIEYVFVNDGSSDKTYNEIKKLINNKEDVILINFSRNFGKEAAMLAGLENSTGDYCGIIDADLQQNPKYILEMYNFLVNNPDYDCVSCFQRKRDESFVKKFLKKYFYKFINSISDVKLYPNASDFRLMNRQMVNSLLEIKEYHRFSKGLFSYVGYNTYYMPYDVEPRKFGNTSWSIKKLFNYAFNGIVGLTLYPLKLIFKLSLVSFLCFILYFVISIVNHSLNDNYNLLINILLLINSVNLFALGLIGQYVGKTSVEVRKRPIYIVKSIEK